ncbi:MAG TPA: A/G-specific adenine glycosylase [Burkholderiales bacterium]|nr:A/G-specific adenine glycosylase [Burkholderiales bacterium]
MHSFAARVVRWQRRHGRHDLPWQARDPYRVWLSEIMLQQTRVETVIPYFERFLGRFPNPASLARAPVGEVLRLWSGLGYYARARNLHAAARQIMKEHGGRLPERIEALDALPGIGRSTAGAIAALAFGKPAPMLDANARRVLERCFGVRDEKALWRLAEDLVPGRSAAAYTQGLMDLGAMVCTPAGPACAQCPVSGECRAHRKGVIAKTKRRGSALPVRNCTWMVLVHRGRVLLERRPPRGIWGGLWTFPEADSGKVAGDAGRLGCSVAKQTRLAPFEHGFTHLRLCVQPILCQVTDKPSTVGKRGWRWFRLDTAQSAALPAPARKLLETIFIGPRRPAPAGASAGTGATLPDARCSRPSRATAA